MTLCRLASWLLAWCALALSSLLLVLQLLLLLLLPDAARVMDDIGYMWDIGYDMELEAGRNRQENESESEWVAKR